MSDREDLAMIIAIENGDGQRGPFEADYAAADAIIAAGWRPPSNFDRMQAAISEVVRRQRLRMDEAARDE